MDLPILEFDDSGEEALIEPARVIPRLDDMPDRMVLCFFNDVIKKVCADAEVIHTLGSEIGLVPLYRLATTNPDGEAVSIAVLHPGVGAPLAAAFLDECIAHGASKFIACGGAGVLNKALTLGHLVVPEAAVRDEGTSYHYLPPGREAVADIEATQAIVDTLVAHDLPYVRGKTWTTDAIYRETPARIAKRRAEGCITVEMEAAAFFAVAQFRGVAFGQLLYGGDDVSGDVWDQRDWHRQESTRERVFWLAVEAVTRL